MIEAAEETIERKKEDANDLIKNVLEKIPEEKKIEALRLLEGFSLQSHKEKEAG